MRGTSVIDMINTLNTSFYLNTTKLANVSTNGVTTAINNTLMFGGTNANTALAQITTNKLANIKANGVTTTINNTLMLGSINVGTILSSLDSRIGDSMNKLTNVLYQEDVTAIIGTLSVNGCDDVGTTLVNLNLHVIPSLKQMISRLIAMSMVSSTLELIQFLMIMNRFGLFVLNFRSNLGIMMNLGHI